MKKFILIIIASIIFVLGIYGVPRLFTSLRSENQKLESAGEYLKERQYEVTNNQDLKILFANNKKLDSDILIMYYKKDIDNEYKTGIKRNKNSIKKNFKNPSFIKKDEYHIATGEGYKKENNKNYTKILFIAKYKNFLISIIRIAPNSKTKETIKNIIEKEYVEITNTLK